MDAQPLKNDEDKRVITEKDRGGFFIRKATMIQKNQAKIKDVYKIDKNTLGEGAFGVVRKCKHRELGLMRACKCVPKKKIQNMEKFMMEISILQQLDHPNVLKLYEYFEDEKYVYLVTELCKGGELFDRIQENEFFCEEQAAKIFLQILRPINYCHCNGIAHRDIKPENFIFESKDPDSDLKIIDFGLSKFVKGNTTLNQLGKEKVLEKKTLKSMNTSAGTPAYISPEVLSGNYGVECDMWSAGCILYILLCGYPPFYGEDDAEILGMVMKGKFDFDGEEWEEISKEAKDLIKKLICKPERRLTAAEALEHKWFKKVLKNQKATKIDGSQFKELTKVGQKTKLQQAALTAISVQTSPDDIRHLKELFQKLDVNNDGTLSLAELKKGLEDQDCSHLYEILEAADTDGSGEIDYTEFISATMDAQIYLRDDYLRTAFKMFDKDGSGSIDNQEVLDLLQGEDIQNLCSKEAIKSAMQEIDTNGDGEIDFEEFMAMMKKATEIDDKQ